MYFKGVVMELAEKYAIVMKKNGAMVKIKAKEGLNVGDSILFLDEDIISAKKDTKILFRKTLMPLAAVAVIALIFILPIMSNSMMSKAYAMISLDINPSLTMELDKEKNIINVNPFNSDGENLDLDSLKGLSIEDGIKKLNEILSSQNYLDGNAPVLVGFAFFEDEDDIDFEEYVQKAIRDNFTGSEIAYLKGTNKDINEAINKGISLGRYEADLELDDILEDSIENLSVSELMDLLKQNGNTTYLNEDIVEEIQDELEDRLENEQESDDDSDEDEESLDDDINDESSDDDDESNNDDDNEDESSDD